MFDEHQHEWPPVRKPSAIEHLIAHKLIGEMTADEYAVLARQAQIALYEEDGKLKKLTRRRSVA